MPYTLSISPLLDDGGFYSAALPSLTGRIFSPPPPSGSTATPLDTATSSNLTLSFTSAGVPPAGSSAMILTEPAIGGDFLRSGLVNALPPSPAAVAIWFMYYNFGRVHQTLRVTPAMEAGISDHVW